MKAHYRKLNDRTLNSSTYHKKDGTNIRAKLKEELKREVKTRHLRPCQNDHQDLEQGVCPDCGYKSPDHGAVNP